jgi:hypothetical protein
VIAPGGINVFSTSDG